MNIRSSGCRGQDPEPGRRHGASLICDSVLKVFVEMWSSALAAEWIQCSAPAGAEPDVRRLWEVWYRFGLVNLQSVRVVVVVVVPQTRQRQTRVPPTDLNVALMFLRAPPAGWT